MTDADAGRRSSPLPILLAVAVVVVVLIGLGVVALLRDDDDAEQVVRAAIGQNDALQREDFAAFSEFTCAAERGSESDFVARHRESTQAHGARYVADVNTISVDGDEATATVVYYFENTPDDKITAPTRFVREDGSWKACAETLAGYATLTNVSYAGDITPQESWRLLNDDPDAVLVDVRTEAEWRSVGVPDLSGIGKDVVFLEWVDSSGRPNPDFARDLAAKVPGGPVVFLCRSGNRSIPAAQTATQAGLAPAYNMVHGFEGGADAAGNRGATGWKADGLPWARS